MCAVSSGIERIVVYARSKHELQTDTSRRYEKGLEDSIPYVTTIYSVQIQYNNSDVVLMFRFLNAKKIKGE